MTARLESVIPRKTDEQREFLRHAANLKLQNLHDLCIAAQKKYREQLFDNWQDVEVHIPDELIENLILAFDEDDKRSENTVYNGSTLKVYSSADSKKNSDDLAEEDSDYEAAPDHPVIAQHEAISNEDILTGFILADLWGEMSDYNMVLNSALINEGYTDAKARKDCIVKGEPSVKKTKKNEPISYTDAEKIFTAFYEKNSQLPEEDVNTNIKFLHRYWTQPAWFYRGKTVSRADAQDPAIMKTLGLVNTSSGSVVRISRLLNKKPALMRFYNDIVVTRKDSGKNLPDEYDKPEYKIVSRKEGFREDQIHDAPVTGGKNLIIYGAPGTGKSHYIEKECQKLFPDITRVVFHPEYTYFDFVGSYRPAPVYAECNHQLHYKNGAPFEEGEPFVDYGFVPGPFTNVLVKCWKEPATLHTLVIEELNRADAAAVFGDVFQLLDRRPDGVGDYGINPSSEWRDYLYSQGVGYIFDSNKQIHIPSNMNIVATMNSADQGVNAMDTAFKRRWNYHFLPICYNDSALNVHIHYGGQDDITWGNFIEKINIKLITIFRLPEDRLIGPYFINPNILDVNNPDDPVNTDAIKKVLFYLWDDVLRHENRNRMFGSSEHPILSMSELYDGFPDNDVLNILDNDHEENPFGAEAHSHADMDGSGEEQ